MGDERMKGYEDDIGLPLGPLGLWASGLSASLPLCLSASLPVPN